MNKETTRFSKRMVMAVVFAEIAMCAVILALTCFGFDMTIGVDVLKANTPFAVVVFAAYSGSSAVEQWLVRAKNGTATVTEDETASNG